MANPVCEVLLKDEQLNALENRVDLAAGARVDFQGIVRGSEDGREIDGIDYEAHRENGRTSAAANCRTGRDRIWAAIGDHSSSDWVRRCWGTVSFYASMQWTSRSSISSESMDRGRVEEKSSDLETAPI